MKWRLLIALIGLSITGATSFAQRPPGAEGLAAARPGSQIGEPHLDEPHAGYFGSAGVVRFQLVQGRLCLDAPRHRKGSQSRDDIGIYESVAVTANRGIPSVHYVCQTPRQHLTLSVQDATEVHLESWLPEKSCRCVLTQASSGPIKLTCLDQNKSHQWTASTLIHLRHLQPRVFDRHFGQLFTRMLHGQSMQKISQQTKSAAIDEIHRPMRTTKTQIEQWISDLGSPKRSVRIDAERRLLSGGTAIVSTVHESVLTNKISGDLDAEQIGRLQRILRQLCPSVPDHPRALAKLLVNDDAYWAAIGAELTLDQRRLAATRLKVFGVTVDWEATNLQQTRIAGN